MDLTCLKMAVPCSAKLHSRSRFQMKNLLDSVAAAKTAEVSMTEGGVFFFAFVHNNGGKGVA